MSAPETLDNPIWHALATRHARFAQDVGGAKRFIPDVGPLSGFAAGGAAGLADLRAEKGSIFAFFMTAPRKAPAGWSVTVEGPLVQMLHDGATEPETRGDVTPLGAENSGEMRALAELARPGPFGPRTHELGNFFGVRQDGKLVAMAGERLKLPGFTEISAVCTHPDYTGRGHAAALMARVMQGIAARGETAFLHVRGDNDRAIALYERLGFRKRFSGHFAAFCRE